MPRATKLLHIADVHLDAPFGWLGSRGREQRAQLGETFKKAIDLAMEERVDALLVAGDLFDSNSPSQSAVDLVQAQLRRLEIPIFLLPGTHDCFDDGSIFRKVDFAETIGPRVHVFKDRAQTALELADLDLTVHGRGNETKTSTESPLAHLRKNPRTRFNVALAHGSLASPHTADDFPIAPQDIEASGMDYVALGHWHSYRDCSTAAVSACYSGPIELLAEGELGSAVVVELGEGKARTSSRPLARRRFGRLDLPLDIAQSVEEIVARIRPLGDPDLALVVTLSGIRNLDLNVDAAELARELTDHHSTSSGPAFFSLRIIDKSHPVLSAEEIAAMPEALVIGQFARRMSALIAAAANERERRISEAALQIGLALLKGRRVLP